MTEARLRIQKVTLNLRDFDEAAAGSLADGLGRAIAAAIDIGALRSLSGHNLNRLDLGTVTVARGATPQTVREQVASKVASGLNSASVTQAGGLS